MLCILIINTLWNIKIGPKEEGVEKSEWCSKLCHIQLDIMYLPVTPSILQ